MTAPQTIMIDNVKYVREDAIQQKAINTDGMKIVVVRSPSAGVFMGALKEQKERMVTLLNCRRLWYWDGAFTLSQLATEGVTKPKNCKFSITVDEHLILDACEVIPMTQKAADQIYSITPNKV